MAVISKQRSWGSQAAERRSFAPREGRLTLGFTRLAHETALTALLAVRSPAAPRQGRDWRLEKLLDPMTPPSAC